MEKLVLGLVHLYDIFLGLVLPAVEKVIFDLEDDETVSTETCVRLVAEVKRTVKASSSLIHQAISSSSLPSSPATSAWHPLWTRILHVLQAMYTLNSSRANFSFAASPSSSISVSPAFFRSKPLNRTLRVLFRGAWQVTSCSHTP